MPSPSSNTLVYLRWERSALNAYICAIKNSDSAQALKFSGPIEILTKDEYEHGARWVGAPFFLQANSLDDRKILWPFTGESGKQEPWVRNPVFPDGYQRGLDDAFVLQINKHLANGGRSNKLRRWPERPKGWQFEEANEYVGSYYPASMAQLADQTYLHLQPQGSPDAPNSSRRFVFSSVQTAKQSASDLWKPQGNTEDMLKHGAGTPPGKPASRVLHVASFMKNDYVHFIDVQQPENVDQVNYTTIGDGPEAMAKPKPWIQIHQMAKKDFILGPGRTAPWQTYQLQIPDFVILNWPWLFTCRQELNVPIPVVTPNGKDGFRLWLFSDYFTPEPWRRAQELAYVIYGIYVNLRTDGSIDSYSKSPSFQGGYYVPLGGTQFRNLRATTFDFGTSGIMDHLLLTVESDNGPLSLSVPVRRDGTLGSPNAKEASGAILREEVSDLLKLQKMEVPGVDFKYNAFQANGLLSVPNDFL